jgi:PAS domain S-box-containing protein
MRTFGDMPIRQKLLITIMVTTALAMLLAGVAIVVFDSVLFRGYLARDLSALARIIADNTTAALAFNDPRSAAETLATLRARPHVASACVCRMDGTLLAKFTRPAATQPSRCPPASVADGISFGTDDLTVLHAILLNGRRIGTLVLRYDLDEIAEREKLYGSTVLAVLLGSGLIALLLSAKLRALIVAPIAQLARATTSVSETGDYGIRAQRFSGDELGMLVDRFNEMLAGIQSRDTTLTKALLDREEALRDAEKARERFRFMAESMPQKIFTAAPDGRYDYLNRQWMDFTGLAFEQIEGWGWTQVVHPDDVEANIHAWRQSTETGEPFTVQRRLRRADGVYRWHLSRAHAMRDSKGEISMWIGSSTDIQEQKEKEEELRRANDDLQQFAYSASHDLQEPIRNVAIYSQLVAERYPDRLDDDGLMFLGFIKEGGRRLARLVDDLLAYTRAGIVEEDVSPVDSATVLSQTLAGLAETVRENDAKITFDPLPEVYMGQTHLQQIFQNLIVNALKYRKESPPQIHISALNIGGDWRFSVQDNGIGIDPQYKEKIFGLFKRLHRDQKYSGTGIGLAICQRIVARYGGRIWVESGSGQGATFFFTVPQPRERVRPATVAASAR